MLTNLVGNALKFTGPGGRITLGVDADATEVTFAVTDTGAGIAADRLDRVFERYYQSQFADRRGLGLGLHIARSIVTAHGGRIWAESRLGEGSRFAFTVPRAS